MIVPIFPAEGPLGSLLARDFILFGGQLRFPFLIRFDYFVSHGSFAVGRLGSAPIGRLRQQRADQDQAA